jgi:antitoxin ParD1/3/4
MSKNTSVSLGAHFMGFIDAQIAAGRFSSASDVMRAALRLLEDEQTRLASSRAALIEGEKSGTSTSFGMDAFLKEKRRAASPGKGNKLPAKSASVA